ncbi:hypothetical protein GXP67_02550 [Rhodocytophaga rosea]|uniref:Uncharacterized protein n=1 Tax=Rhodocytophaga rosea TaxID=2704465 RepID=A0A6C0GCR7_9BACT|nr:hypothetical protein [Rhodocytophaga rosea]QHT65622.1 hypothetical protein GXP67_02550 [Rhodocytophaga rosea]
MSTITNIIISASLYGAQEMFGAQLNAYTSKLNVPPFVKIDKCTVGGNNCLRADLFIAAFNNLDLDVFIDFFKSLHYWDGEQDQRNTLQLFIKRPEDSIFGIYTQETISQLQAAG